MAQLYHSIKYYCAALVAVMVLASAGCELLEQCDNGPDNAIRTLGGAGAVVTLKDSSDYDMPTYTLNMAESDPYLRWKTTDGDYGITTCGCLATYWNTTFSNNWQSVVIWSGSSESVCGEIRSLKVYSGILQAELRLKRTDGTALLTAASLVLALGRDCPTGTCSGKFTKNTCFTPYATYDNATSYLSLPAVDLNFATLSGSRFYRANLSGASLSNATLAGVDFQEADLEKASLVSADLTGAILYQTNLNGAALYGANLTSADMRETKLNNAVLSYANLAGAYMEDVELSGALVYQTIAPDNVTVDDATALLLHSIIL